MICWCYLRLQDGYSRSYCTFVKSNRSVLKDLCQHFTSLLFLLLFSLKREKGTQLKSQLPLRGNLLGKNKKSKLEIQFNSF